MNKAVKKGSGGRPSAEEASRLPDKIMDAAAELFFAEGYGAVSIEAIAKAAKISKRTFYARYPDKAAVFRAVVHRLIHHLRPEKTESYFAGKSLDALLLGIAKLILQAALKPQALAMHRIIVAESLRFPELALIMNEEGARKEAITRIAALLQKDASAQGDASYAAEQFLQMVTSVPQRRALGLGQPMNEAELDRWARDTVTLFLHGWSVKI